MDTACGTCAQLLADVSPIYDEKTEKPKALDRTLNCCGRVICGNCIHNNPRFATYCPFCQGSLKDPPAYNPPPSSTGLPVSTNLPPSYIDDLPSYSSLAAPQTHTMEKPSNSQPADDVLHFLDHAHDTLTSISFRYGVPISVLRRANNITSDYLLLARRTIIVPGEFYKGGVSLSPRPVEGEEEERRKAIVRRWMVACKVSEYDVALVYLTQVDYDLEAAIAAYKDDERWEKEHPIAANVKGKGKTRPDVGKRRFTGQRSSQ